LNKLKLTEEYLNGHSTPGDALLFEARLIIEPELHEQLQHQQQAYRLINQYGRQQLKAQLNEVHEQLFTLPRYARFRRWVFAIFRKD